jgi:hypothetical protein
MIELEIIVLGTPEHDVPRTQPLYDYLVFTAKAEWKFDVVLKAISRAPKKGDKVIVDDMWIRQTLLGGTGVVNLEVEEYTSKKDNKTYKQNKIVSWVVNPKGADGKALDLYKMYPPVEAVEGGEVPF